MTRLFAALLFAIFSTTNPVVADDWVGGIVRLEWGEGQPCTGGTCFRIRHTGVGKLFDLFHTSDCSRRQVMITTIENSPIKIDRYEVTSKIGTISSGLDRVDFHNGSIVVRTYLIQDHGGPGNPCIRPGMADFELRFSVTNQ